MTICEQEGVALERSVSKSACAALNAGRLPEGMFADTGGMGFEGIQVGCSTMDLGLYIDTTFGGDDGYTPTLRCYVTLGNECIDHGWDLPAGPTPTAPVVEIADYAETCVATVLQRVLLRDVPTPN